MTDVNEILKRQNTMIGHSLLHMDRLVYLQKSISLLSFQDMKSVLVAKLPYCLSIRYFTLFLYEKAPEVFKLACHNRPTILEDLVFPVGQSLIMSDVLEQCRYMFEADYEKSKYFQGQSNPLFKNPFFICIPLMIEDEILGILNLNDNDKGFITSTELDYILNISELIALAMKNALRFEKVEKSSITDVLTNLSNRQQMNKTLNDELARSKRYGFPLSILILDVDNFKSINDTHGHQKGDEVLIALAEVLKNACRSHDLPVRYGGEEFILILPQTHKKDAYLIGERVRESFSKIPFKSDGEKWHVTLSCGIAEYNSAFMGTTEDLIALADKALYIAKNSGKNRTNIGNQKI